MITQLRMTKLFPLILMIGLSAVSLGAAGAKSIKLVAFGDSLTAGYGLDSSDGFTAQLEQRLRAAGFDVEVANLGVSGDTTKGGLARLDWSVDESADGVLLELGANDALRGLDPALAHANLSAILARFREKKIPVLLLGMKAPRSFDDTYVEAFDAIYPDLAEEYQVPLYPFFLEGVAGSRALNQNDAIHPNAEGVKVIVESMLPAVTAFLKSLS